MSHFWHLEFEEVPPIFLENLWIPAVMSVLVTLRAEMLLCGSAPISCTETVLPQDMCCLVVDRSGLE